MKSERMEAAARGDVTYHGGKCSKCGETLRYVLSANCVACSKKASTKSSKRQVETIRALREQARAHMQSIDN